MNKVSNLSTNNLNTSKNILKLPPISTNNPLKQNTLKQLPKLPSSTSLINDNSETLNNEIINNNELPIRKAASKIKNKELHIVEYVKGRIKLIFKYNKELVSMFIVSVDAVPIPSLQLFPAKLLYHAILL